MARIDAFLKLGLAQGCSDIHLAVGVPPMLRMHGDLMPIKFRDLGDTELESYVSEIMTPAQKKRFEDGHDLDFSYVSEDGGRFRVNVYRKETGVGATFRTIPGNVPTLESLELPPVIRKLLESHQGMILVTGSTGTGKSTSLAAMIDHLNSTQNCNIISLEDPIEFMHRSKQAQIIQRELGTHLPSFAEGIRAALREDPDVILVGELRDLETISLALTAAETGHLVFATLHTQDTAQTIDRIIDVFPPHQQQQVRSQLAMALQGVVCQTLAKTADGHGRVVATEVLVVTPAVRNLIREGKSHQIYSVMQAGAAHGMHTLDQHLADLVRTRRITYEVGLEKCHHIEDFNRLCGRA
jgi:twitching motility protein PilT